jgi:hypothetical protein
MMNQIKEGFYLETKTSRVGTGHTASDVTFRNFYLARPAGAQVECFLLDDKLNPTGIKELLTLQEFTEKGWQYLPQLQKRYSGVCAKLAAPPVPKQPAQAPQKRPQAGAPQVRSAAPPPTAKPASPPPAQKPAKPQGGDTPWWELTSKGSGDLFKK